MFIKHVKNMSGPERLSLFCIVEKQGFMLRIQKRLSIFLSKYSCSEVRKDFFMKTFIYVARRYIVDVALPIKLVLAKPVVIFSF